MFDNNIINNILNKCNKLTESLYVSIWYSKNYICRNITIPYTYS